MPFIEAPTTFYLGRRVDPATQQPTDEVIYYDSRDLTTHAVVLGMTGSGKTGLCITLLEEAALDGIPSIIIDPKGDITNLLLAFPELRPQDFAPWVNLDDARRAGLEADAYAEQVARQWREGLAQWDISSDRIARFTRSASFAIYTPGSDAGVPVSILDAMQAPPAGWGAGEDEFHRERINGLVTALLALIGRNAQPVRDREHVLIANLIEHAWRRGQSLTLADVIQGVQRPPFPKLGVFDVDTFFPEKDRFALAMELNHIIAAPSFQSWLQGETLDIQSLLYTPDGHPRVSIFYIAHLNDAERMFIVTLLLENMLAWMRTLSGTTSLRALLYFDEVFGFFPSHPYNPPSKEPLLRLLKQARAFGLGVILATQNPADLDYKGLANAGTWFIGKLQTENDKDKVLQGLENVATAEDGLNLRDVDRLLSSLGRRVFLMHNVHNQGGPILLHTRWAMSYLRGPLTRQQIRELLAAQRAQQPAPAAAATPPPPSSLPEMPSSLPEMPPRRAAPPPPATLPEAERAVEEPTQPTALGVTPPPREPIVASQPALPLPAGLSLTPPLLPSAIAQFFLTPSLTVEAAAEAWQREQGRRLRYEQALVAYEPVLLAQAEVRFADRKTGLAESGFYAYQVRDVPRAGSIAWDEHRVPYTDPRELGTAASEKAAYGELPPALSDPRRLTALQRDLEDYLYRTAALIVLHNPELDLYGTPGMTRRDFLVQAGTLARQRRDAEVDSVVARYDKIFDKIEDQLQRTARALAAEQQELESLRDEEMWTTGEAVLSLLRGRTTYTLSRMSRARRFRERAHGDVYEAEQRINELEAELDAAQQAMEEELRRVHEKWTQVASLVQEYRITPYKKDIFVSTFGVGWVPYWLLISGDTSLLLPAWPVRAGGAA
jgi:prefoldin subunit 5